MEPTSSSESDILARWPRGRPVGLLVLSAGDPAAWAGRVSGDPSVDRWWDCVAQNMFSGPQVDPPFHRALAVEVADAEKVAPLVADLARSDDSGTFTVLAATPIPAMARRGMRAMAGLLRLLPKPRSSDETLDPVAPQDSPVNPTQAQIDRFLEGRPQDPVMVVNLNLHKETGIHPDTGREESGRTIADNYFRRGIRTFSRLGARPAFAGACRGAVVDGLGVGRFDQIGLIRYQSRADFATLLRIGFAEGWGRYREAGLDRSWVVHCRVEASSQAGDL